MFSVDRRRRNLHYLWLVLWRVGQGGGKGPQGEGVVLIGGWIGSGCVSFGRINAVGEERRENWDTKKGLIFGYGD